MKSTTVCVAGLLWLFAATATSAAALTDAIPGHAGLTTLDLAKLLVPDLGTPDKSGQAVGHKTVAYQNIDTTSDTIDAPDTITLHSYDVETMDIPGDPSRILVLADLGSQEGYVADLELLGLVSLSPKPTLVAVTEVGQDREVGLLRKTDPPMLAPKTPLVIVQSEHNDADEAYSLPQLLFVEGDRFRLIGGLSTFSEKDCGYTLTETPSYATRPGSGPYAAIDVSVMARIKANGVHCDETQKKRKLGVTTYRAVYQWDEKAQRFTTPSKDFQRLSTFNDKYP